MRHSGPSSKKPCAWDARLPRTGSAHGGGLCLVQLSPDALIDAHARERTPTTSTTRIHPDVAVIRAYGFDATDDLLAQLLALNLATVEDSEVVRRPGGHGLNDVYTSDHRLQGGELATTES